MMASPQLLSRAMSSATPSARSPPEEDARLHDNAPPGMWTCCHVELATHDASWYHSICNRACSAVHQLADGGGVLRATQCFTPLPFPAPRPSLVAVGPSPLDATDSGRHGALQQVCTSGNAGGNTSSACSAAWQIGERCMYTMGQANT